MRRKSYSSPSPQPLEGYGCPISEPARLPPETILMVHSLPTVTALDIVRAVLPLRNDLVHHSSIFPLQSDEQSRPVVIGSRSLQSVTPPLLVRIAGRPIPSVHDF